MPCPSIHPKQRNSADVQDLSHHISPKSQSYGSHVLRVHMEFHHLDATLEGLPHGMLKQLLRHAAATEHWEHGEAHDVALAVTWVCWAVGSLSKRLPSKQQTLCGYSRNYKKIIPFVH